jgi:hypothetical protein
MLTAVVLLPALLAMLGHNVNRLSLPSLASAAPHVRRKAATGIVTVTS